MTTRANVEAIIVRRLGAKLTAAGLAVTCTGSNADLNDPIGEALRMLGLTVIDPLNIADADVAGVSGDDLSAFLAVTELRTLENISGNLTLVDQSIGPRRMNLGQIADQVEKAIARLTSKIQREYGYGVGALQGGAVSLDFQEKPTLNDVEEYFNA